MNALTINEIVSPYLEVLQQRIKKSHASKSFLERMDSPIPVGLMIGPDIDCSWTAYRSPFVHFTVSLSPEKGFIEISDNQVNLRGHEIYIRGKLSYHFKGVSETDGYASLDEIMYRAEGKDFHSPGRCIPESDVQDGELRITHDYLEDIWFSEKIHLIYKGEVDPDLEKGITNLINSSINEWEIKLDRHSIEEYPDPNPQMLPLPPKKLFSHAVFEYLDGWYVDPPAHFGYSNPIREDISRRIIFS